jgi:hypothetical protein
LRSGGGHGKSGKFFNDRFGKILFDLPVARNRLADFGILILIPVVASAVTNEFTAEFHQFADKVSPLHATTSSSWWMTPGMASVERSL